MNFPKLKPNKLIKWLVRLALFFSLVSFGGTKDIFLFDIDKQGGLDILLHKIDDSLGSSKRSILLPQLV